MRPSFVALLLAFGVACSDLTEAREDLTTLKAEHAALDARVALLEQRLAALEAPAAPAAEPVLAVAPKPAARPLVVPATPKPVAPPAPVIPAGPVGKVQVSAPRDGLGITIDDVPRDETTPALIILPTGRHTVRVDGYAEQEIRVLENETVLVVPR